MRREKFIRMSWSRFAEAWTAALIILLLAGAARADIIRDFVVSGAGENISGGSLGSCAAGATCRFSGIMMVDVTAGFVTGVNITFPGLSAFNQITNQGVFVGDGNFVFPEGYGVEVRNSTQSFDLLFATFTMSATPLVGFEHGYNVRRATVVNFSPPSMLFYEIPRGGIVITPVPEPSSLALLGTGLVGFGGMLRRKLKR